MTEFEFGDPPMGFVHGEFIPTNNYSNESEYENIVILHSESFDRLNCTSIVIEDYSVESGMRELHITAQLDSAGEYEKYFIHHINAYDQSFE